jgi:hypothetical protein
MRPRLVRAHSTQEVPGSSSSIPMDGSRRPRSMTQAFSSYADRLRGPFA